MLVLYKDHVVVSANRDVLFLNQANGTVLNKFSLPAVDRSKFDKKKTAEANDEEEAMPEENLNENVQDEDGENKLELCKIQHMTVSGNNELLAITTSAEEKCLFVYQLTDTLAIQENDDQNVISSQLISKRDLSRSSNVIRFAPDSKQLLVADKTGDCYIFDSATDAPGKWVLGHFSMVLDILFTSDLKYIITCDRDEKIRITNYPSTYLIECYCLGHKEYVGAVEFLPTAPEDTLISVSGDKTMKLWHYQSGDEISEFVIPAPGLRMAVRKHNDGNHIAVTFVEHTAKLALYEVSKIQNQYTYNEIKLENKLDNVNDVIRILFDSHGNLIVAAITKENAMEVYKFTYVDEGYKSVPVHQWNKTIASNLAIHGIQFNVEEISLLFKKKFDNIHDYQERKKRRIQEKNKHKSS